MVAVLGYKAVMPSASGDRMWGGIINDEWWRKFGVMDHTWSKGAMPSASERGMVAVLGYKAVMPSASGAWYAKSTLSTPLRGL